MQGDSGTLTAESVAPGSLVVVRDEEWVVTQVAQTQDGTLVTAQGLSELVAGTTAQFYSELDEIVPFDPRRTRVVADGSKNHQQARLWLEATLRKTALPIDDDRLAVTPEGDIDPDELERLAIRRHRHSPDDVTAVTGDWAERQEPVNRLVTASPEEDAIASELADHWLYAERTPTPGRGNSGDALVGWTLAKAFLSSPAALAESARNRLTQWAVRVETLWSIALRRLTIAEAESSRRIDIWERPGEAPAASTITREQIEASLADPDGAWQRLHTLMNPWCALWFWPLTETAIAPPTKAVQAAASSLLADFYVRAAPKSTIRARMFNRLPMVPADHPLLPKVLLRALRLNCVTDAYGDLWAQCWDDALLEDEPILPRFDERPIGPEWTPDTPLRRAADRRNAQVEIDSMVAIMLAVPIEDLCTIYRTQFAVLYGYDHREYTYDANGRLVPNSVLSLRRKLGEPQDPSQMPESYRTAIHPGSRTPYTYSMPFGTLDRQADFRRTYGAVTSPEISWGE